MKAKLLIVLVLVALVFSCTTVSFQGIQAVKDMPNFTVVGDFEKTFTDIGILGAPGGYALITLDDKDERIFVYIQEEIQKLSGDGAINVDIEYGASLLQILVGGFTSGIIAPSRITIRGTVVKFSE